MSDEQGGARFDATPRILIAAAQLLLDLESKELAGAAEDVAIQDGADIDEPVAALRSALELIEARLVASTRADKSTAQSDGPPKLGRDPQAGWTYVFDPSPSDLRALGQVLGHVSTTREQPDGDSARYLDYLIQKPWGSEYRLYDDALIDAWLVAMDPTTRTSLHAHRAKDTMLLCLTGQGTLSTGDGVEVQLEAQTAVHIGPGASYRIEAHTGLDLVAIDNPRDKFDIVRFADDSGRRGGAYESHADVARLLPELVAVPSGPPRARMRCGLVDGKYELGLQTGADLRRSPLGLLFAVALDLGSVVRHELSIVRMDEVDRTSPAHLYLTIRGSVHAPDE